MIRRVALVTAFAIAVPAVARADDKARAAEHFALAQAAERRKDWRSAIDEYEQAYRLSPHPSVLYNIALNQERLAAWREAARYFLRYVDGSPDATDREVVLARVRGLREKPSSVTVEVRPVGARVYVDGSERGRSPINLALVGGRTYEVIAMDDRGNQSAPRRIAPEYGESFTLALQADAGEDEPPAPGNDAADSQISGEGGGGPLPPAPQPEPQTGGPKLVSSGGLGYQTGDQATRFTFSLGYRSPGNQFELGFLAGKFGPMQALGGEVRIYFTSMTVRPYLRAGWLYGWYDFESSATALEGGGGLLVATSPAASAARHLGIDYYLEVIGHRRSVDKDPGLLGDPDDLDGTSLAIVIGIGARLGK